MIPAQTIHPTMQIMCILANILTRRRFCCIWQELRTRIAAWEGKKTDDFQYEPERAELKAQMKDWLAEKLGIDDEKKLLIANRKYFATCMAELVYEETVRPNMKDFIH